MLLWEVLLQEGSGVIKDKCVTRKSPHHLAVALRSVTAAVQEACPVCGGVLWPGESSALTELIWVIMHNGVLFS